MRKQSSRFTVLTSAMMSSDNGKALDSSEFFDFLVATRKAISDRQLLTQSFVVSPADKGGLTGQVAHTSYFSGVQEGKAVAGTIVSILKIGMYRGARIVQTESFVFALDQTG